MGGSCQRGQAIPTKTRLFHRLCSTADIGKPPHDWQINTKAIGFYTKDADLQAKKVSVGTRIVFAGTLAKTPDDFAGTGVTAYHGVGKKAGTNFIALRPDTTNISIVRVVGQAAK